MTLTARCRLASDTRNKQSNENPKEPLARLVAAWAAIYEKDLDRAKSEAENALSLDPNLAMAYNTLGGIRSYSGNRWRQFQ